MSRTIAYARTSTGRQDLGIRVQEDAFKLYKPDRIYCEQISGRIEKRPELLKALRTLRRGDTLLIYKLDRLGRSTQQLVNIMNRLNERGIHLKSIHDNIDTTSPNGKFFFTIMSAFAELESDMISERTRDALKKTNKKCGRPKINEEIKRRVIKMNNNGISKAKIAKDVGISLSSVYNITRTFFN